MRYVLTGGGTGGHVYPNLAIAGEIGRHDPDAQFLYIGVKDRAEADIVPRHGIPIRFVPARGMPERKKSLAIFPFFFALLWGTLKALLILLRYRPHLVVATGGYASAPTLLAARFLRRGIIVHEQNAFPGLVNRTFGKMAGRVCVTFEETLVHFQHNGVLVGYPVRPEILALRTPLSADDKRRAKQELGIAPHRKVVLITGGSLGARSINRAVADMMPGVAADPQLRDNVLIMHGVGRTAGREYHAEQDTQERLAALGFDEEASASFYRREPYLYEIEKWLRVADVVVCRAGAGSLAETAAAGVPALVVPKSGLPGDHQVKNAEAMRAAGACLVLREVRAKEADETYDAVEAGRLLGGIKQLLSLSPEQRAAMGDAAHRFVAADCLPRIYAAAHDVLAGPAKSREAIRRRRTFLVDEKGRKTEVLFDRSRVGAGRWDDVRPSVAGLSARHFWLRRQTKMGEGRIDENWQVVPRAELKVLRAGASEPEEVAGPTLLAANDRLVLSDGATLSFAFEWIDVQPVATEKGAVENVFSQGAGTLAAKVVGLFREGFLSRFFGAGTVMDVFAVALTLANLMREVVAEMALESAFLPSFRLFYGRSDDKRPAWRLAWQVFNLFFVLAALLAAVGIVTCPWWIHLVAPGFVEKGLISQTTAMTRLMFPFLLLMSISAFFGTLLQSFDRFGPNAFSPVLYSVGLIFSVVALHKPLGMYALGVGVLLGGALQIAFQLFFLMRRGMREKIAWSAYRPMVTGEPGVKKVVALSGPIFLDAMLNKFSGVIDKVLASLLIAGSVSALYFSRLLVVMPFSVIAMSINRVFLRDLSDVAAGQDLHHFRDRLRTGIDATLFLMLPTSALMIALSTPIVRFIYEGGAFTAENTTMTSLALICYAIGLIGWSLTSLYSRVFSSQLDTRSIPLTSGGSLAVYLVFAVILINTPLAHAGLALATSIGFLFNMVWRHVIISRRLAADGAPLPLADLTPTVLKTLVASTVMILVVLLVYVDPGSGRGLLVNLWALALPAGAGLFAFLLLSYLLRTRPLIDLLNHYAGRLGLGAPFGRDPIRYRNGSGNLRTLAAGAVLSEAQSRKLNDDEQTIVRERMEIWLHHDDWWFRNIGIKLIGALKLTDKIDVLIEAITAETEPSWWRSRLLGSRREVGFIRRNAIHALRALGVCDDRVRTALIAALDDPYYEARQAALQAVLAFADACRTDAALVAAVQARMFDRHFEVVPIAARTYAEVATTPEAFEVVRGLLDDPRWPVRAAAARACRRLFDRGVMTDAAALREALSRTMLAGEEVEPESPLKVALKEASEDLPGKES